MVRLNSHVTIISLYKLKINSVIPFKSRIKSSWRAKKLRLYEISRSFFFFPLRDFPSWIFSSAVVPLTYFSIQRIHKHILTCTQLSTGHEDVTSWWSINAWPVMHVRQQKSLITRRRRCSKIQLPRWITYKHTMVSLYLGHKGHKWIALATIE